ncbi:hypothetical protein MMC34_005272 [Xylographa carneopallida]|nr:hypothetical protein [Xylographa carneopallida]
MRNSVESPLLKLPYEIRGKIWREVLGDHHVHIVRGVQAREPPVTNFTTYDTSSPVVPYQSTEPLKHYICVQEQTEMATYQQWKTDIECGSAKSVEHWKHKNECTSEFQCDRPFCPATESHQEYNAGRKLQLSLLGSCRQIYVEANKVLWGTNTFSFEGTKLLRDFLAQLNAQQKQLLRKVHVKWNALGLHFDALSKATIKALRGLKVLHITMALNISPFQYSRWSQYRASHLRSVLELRILPLEVVTVTYDCQVNPHGSSMDIPPPQRLELAESIRSRLLGSDVV